MLNTRITIVDEGGVWISLVWMVDVAEVIQVLATRLPDHVHLLLTVHTRSISQALGWHFLTVVIDSHFNDSVLDTWDFKQEAKQLHQSGLRVTRQVLIPHVECWDRCLNLCPHLLEILLVDG